MSKSARGWTFEVYPSQSRFLEINPVSLYDGSDGYGTSPDDWIEKLRSKNLQFAVSPLHQFDVNPDGKTKKPHWHVYLYFPGKKSFDQICEISQGICRGTIPLAVDNPIGLIRYFIHLDNPEKYQYSRDDIQVFGGLDLDDYFKVSKTENIKTVCEIIKFCKINRIDYYNDLIDNLIANESWQWLFICMSTNTLAIQAYVNSMRNQKRDNQYIMSASRRDMAALLEGKR